MNLTIAKDQLLAGLQSVQNVVSTRTTLPILSNVLLRADGSRLELTATDLDVTISSSVEATVKKPGATTVPVKKLFGIARELAGTELDLEGESIKVIEVGAGEADVSSALYVPSIKAVATGDQVFNGIHVWLVEYRPEGSLEGIRRIREAGPIDVVLPGHGPAGGPELLDANERYIHDFMDAAAAAASKQEAVAKMLEAYGDYDLPVILDFGMQAAVEGRSYPDIMQRFLRGES